MTYFRCPESEEDVTFCFRWFDTLDGQYLHLPLVGADDLLTTLQGFYRFYSMLKNGNC